MVKILNAIVRKNAQGVWCPFTLEITLEKEFNYRSMVYEKKIVEFRDGKSALYFAEKEGFVSFFAWNTEGKPERGFGGGRFTLNVKQADGSISTETLIGPWSSNDGAMARAGFLQAVNVVTNDRISTHITLDLAKEIVKKFNLPYEWRQFHPSYQTEPDAYCYVLYPVAK